MQNATVKGTRLSLQQARLWSFLQEEDTHAYHTYGAILVEGNVQPERVLHALQLVVSRHEILHTVFRRFPGIDIPLQVVSDAHAISFTCIDITAISEAAQQQQIAMVLNGCRQRFFVLDQGPLVYLTLLRMDTQRHLLCLELAPLCADASTIQAMLRELMQFYRQETGEPAQIEEEPLQYADVSAWQYDLLNEPEGEVRRRYWEQFDLDALAAQRFPSERPLSTITSFTPRSHILHLEAALQTQLLQLAQYTSCSSSTLLLACWLVTLWRLTGIDYPIGVVLDGRFYEELEQAIGFYTRVVPFTYQLGETLPFDHVLAQVARRLNEAIEYQDSFVWSTTSAGFLQISFSSTTWPTCWEAGNVRLTLYEQESLSERFCLQLRVQQTGDNLQLSIAYDASQITSRNIEVIAAALQTLLQDVVQHPGRPIDELALLSAQQKEYWSYLATPPVHIVPEESTVQAAFEAQVRRTPDAMAVTCRDQTLSYAELNQQANRLAHVLRRQGIGPDTLVGLCLERSVTMLVALLGILKAGGAYVPLDPDQPAARLQYQLHDARLTHVLTASSLLPALPSWNGDYLCLDTLGPVREEETDNPPPMNQPEDLTYVIYTSGSTGMPKGVMIRHRGVTNYTISLRSVIAPEEGWQFATVSTLAADLGNTVIFCSLISGGCLHILPYDIVTDGDAFARYVATHPIDVLKIVPSHLSALLHSTSGSTVLPRKYLVSGGEALSPTLLQRIASSSATCSVINHYGPTETTIGALIANLGVLTPEVVHHFAERQTVPIGRPIASTEVYILDRHEQPVPAGTPGELSIGGAGLAAGYLHQPALTEERFLPHPFSEQPGARLYKTGDLARLALDGNVEFIGRVDTQIKLRGHRIEPGEIEHHLLRHPDVDQCVVLRREDQPGNPQLVAYIVPHPATAPAPAALRNFLHTLLPEVMIPSTFVALHALPLTSNGKLDRQQLPEPVAENAQGHLLPDRPHSPIEDALLRIWEDILPGGHYGLHTSFFTAGGHSLLATQVIARVRTYFAVELPILSLFEDPTIAGMAERITQALQHDQQTDHLPLLPVDHTQRLPLSFAQQRLWFLDQLTPESISYHKPLAFRLRGALHLSALEQSIREIVRRHEILRTTFQTQDGAVYQVIRDEDAIFPHMYTYQQVEQPEHLTREEQLRQFVFLQMQQPFDLQQGPLLRVTLLHLDTSDHLLLLIMHHVVSDAWSNTIMVQELCACYTALSRKTSPLLPSLPVQYADYALWQRQWLQGDVLHQQLSYWQQQLRDLSPLHLPTDHPRPPMQRFHGARQSCSLSPSLHAALKHLSQQQGVTLFMTLLAAFQVLLARYSGQDDIAVGTPIANRTRPETERLIGFFVNTLVVRTDLSGNPRFVDLLQRVKAVALAAYSHQDLPFEQVVEALQPERDLSRSPLFQVMFILQNTPETLPVLDDISIEPVAIADHAAKFDLTFALEETEQGIRCHAEYSTDLFEAATITRMLGHWEALLEGIITSPDQPIHQLPLLQPHEYRQVIQEWNSTERTQRITTLHQLVAEQAQRTPDAIALVFEDASLTYEALEHRAHRLAHHLHNQGVGPETLVGVCLERSLELVIALLGILKAGAAYVPFDPGYPRERLHFMMADSGTPMVLTRPSLAERILPEQTTTLLDIDMLLSLPADNEQHDLSWNVDPSQGAEQLAYMIYTSGSTGRPKGAMNTHRAICNRLLWAQDTYRLNGQDRVVQKTPFSFDVSVWEFFGPLLAGATLVLATPGRHGESTYLVDVIWQHSITLIHFVPSMLRTFVLEPDLERCRSLRQVLCSGEALLVETVQQLQQRLSVPVDNLYGPTEAAVDVSRWSYRNLETPAQIVPIGTPIWNVELYVLDSSMQPSPIGIAGELYIGGIALARGYWQHPELTAERFLPDPFSSHPGSRLYRTGDLVRTRLHGCIEYLGRIDHQVKIRGFRIEPGEIEAVLHQHPGVQACAILVREDRIGEQQLVAYVVRDEQQVVSAHLLRTYLQERLPDYMVPTGVVFLEAFPLLSNGKLDRQALPAPTQEAQDLGEQQRPRNAIEETVGEIWRDLLDIPSPGINENFFALGGHSLLATRVLSRIRQVLNVDITLKTMFEQPTIAGLAQHIADTINQEQPVQELPLQLQERPERLPLSFAQQRLWFLDQLEPGHILYTIPLAVRIQGPLQQAALENSLREMVRRHETLRTTFSSQSGQPVQVIKPDGWWTWEIQDVSTLPVSQREQLVQDSVQAEADAPFDLDQGPLFRVRLLRLGDDEHVLLLTMHHIISDGWSLQVLWRELRILYAAYIHEHSSPLPSLPIQYADYALWQRQWLQGDVLHQQLSYWQQQLRDLSPLHLPTDHPRPPMQRFHGARQSCSLSPSLHAALKHLSQQQGVTLFMTLLAAFQVLLARYSGQDDIAVGTPIANRTRPETERLIGFFVNTLVVRTDLSGNPRFVDLLQRVKAVALAAYSHQDLPFEQVVEALQPERDLSRSPLFQVMFILQTLPDMQPELRGLQLSPLQRKTHYAKFDLTLTLVDTGQEGLQGVIEYSTDLFEHQTIERFLQHWMHLLQSIVEQPEQHINYLPLLTPHEYEHLVNRQAQVSVNEYSMPYVLELFAQQVQRTPEAIALQCEDLHLSYTELDERSNQLAHYLQDLEIGQETLVGLHLRRSPGLVICVLAILKAGGAYVPLDPDYPQQRLRFILQDARIHYLFRDDDLPDGLRSRAIRHIHVQEALGQSAYYPRRAPSVNYVAQQTAYVIYTSGSTGEPKGVQVTQQGIGNLAIAQSRAFEIQQESRLLQFASWSFDASVSELWMALVTGSTLVLAQAEQHAAGSDLQAVLEEQAITVVTLPPSLLSTLTPSSLPLLRTLIVAGEASTPDVLRPWSTDRACFNAYGPTEMTVCATLGRYTPDQSSVHLGEPLAHTQLYLLDSALQPVPINVIGEIYLAGPGLARGYLNRAALTAERFVPHPFSHEPGARLYRTGDLGRYTADGMLAFVGRADQQVKIHGYRIEIGEIEATLRQHPVIEDVVVIPRHEHSGQQRLIAYYITQSGTVIDSDEITSLVLQKLPQYMLPGTFVHLEQFPLLPNGKLDRLALPDPGALVQQRTVVQPRTSIETTLLRIWQQVLGIEQISIDDNFFALGGDSIVSIQVMARLLQAGFQVRARDLFQHQTIAQLATIVEQATPIKQEPLPQQATLPFTPIQHWFFAQNLPHPEHFTQARLLECRHRVSYTHLARAWMLVLQRHDVFTIRFCEAAPGEWQQTYTTDERVEHTLVYVDVTHLSGDADTQVAHLEKLLQETQASLRLEGPLVRAQLIERGQQHPQLLFLVCHHLLIDAFSWNILLDELEHIYECLQTGTSPHIPPSATTFGRWTHLLHQYAQTAQVRQEVDLWLSLLPQEHTTLPVDDVAGTNLVADQETHSVTLDSASSQDILKRIPALSHVHVQELLLTTLAQALTSWSRQPGILIDLEGHGREDIFPQEDLSHMIGWCTALFPLYIDIQSTIVPLDILKYVKAQLRALPHHGLGYGVLRYLHPDSVVRAALSDRPAAQVCFNYLGQHTATAEQSLWRHASIDSGPVQAADNRRTHLLTVTAQVIDEQLALHFEYSRRIHQPEHIAQLAHSMLNNLKQLVIYCQTLQQPLYTPGDFPLAQLPQDALDRIVRKHFTQDHQLEQLYPLSPLQAGLFFHAFYQPDVPAYFEQLCWQIDGFFQESAWQQAWQQGINRHAVLRTQIIWDDTAQPLQAVVRTVETPWLILDWRHLDAQTQKIRLQQLQEADRSKGFALDRAPLLRFTLVRLQEQRYYFQQSHHHLILDGWSQPLLLKEVLTLYQAFCQGSAPALPAVPTYSHYIDWLRQQDNEQAEHFWRHYLRGFATPIRLAIDTHPGEESHGQVQQSELLQLTESTSTALRQLARQEHLTLNTIIQGIWALLLSRYSGSDDIIFGTTVTGRPASLLHVESMVGLFINTLPVRVQIEPHMLLLPWLKRLQEQQGETRQFEYSALVDIQRWSEVPAGQALFNTLLVYQNYPVNVDLRDLERDANIVLQELPTFEQTHYPLLFKVATRERSLGLHMQFDTTHYNVTAIRDLLQHLQVMLDAVAEQPVVQLQALPWLSRQQRYQLIYEWNATQKQQQQEWCLQTLFEQQARRTPDALAVSFEDEALTYAELNLRARQCAHYLHTLGAGPGVPVGLCMERSVSLMIALLAILKAGSAYVPLDPHYPPARLQSMLQQGTIPFVVTDYTGAAILQHSTVPLIILQDRWSQILKQPDQEAAVAVQPEHPIYIIYTSGSTGQPKGIEMPHGVLSNLLFWQQTHSIAGTGTRTLQFTSISFDVACQECFATWMTGGTLCLITEEQRMDPMTLLHIMHREGIERLYLPFVALQQLAQASSDMGTTSLPATLREVITAGEQLQVTPTLRAFFINTGSALYNQYGPAETHVVSAFGLPADPEQWEVLPPVGRPITGTQLYILDRALEPVPPGITGEIYIGGAALAQGYHGQPVLTAERFLPNPFSTTPGGRLYKTGDLGRYRNNGLIEFVGRSDQQVKIRGYRVELGEIEAVLHQQKGVRDAVVLLHEEGNNRFLVAYVVLHHARNSSPESMRELREVLQQILPDYMVPAQIMVLQELPFTPSGKVDRRQLPRPEGVWQAQTTQQAQARTPIEEVLQEIWRQVLGLSVVGVHDNFFDLGGHSLLATQVIARVRTTLQIDVPLRLLFEQPTITFFARQIEALLHSEHRITLPAIIPVAREGHAPLSFAQQRLWFLYQLNPLDSAYTIRLVLRMHGPLQTGALAQSVYTLIQRHESLRTTFHQRYEEAVQVIETAEHMFTFTVVDIATLPEARRRETVYYLIAEEGARPFDLEHGPLLRTTIIRTGEHEHMLLLMMHHIVSDAWSIKVLLQELATSYAAHIEGKPVPLPPLPVQYADVAHWQQSWLQGEMLDHLASYWKQQLAGATALSLPTDRPRSPALSTQGASYSFSLPAQLTTALRQLSRQESVTLFMTLLAAFQVLLARVSGQEDVVVGTDIANRTAMESELLIGFFINVLALRTDLSDHPSFRQLLHRVRETVLGAYTHQHMPFEKLVDILHLERAAKRTPLIQILFVLQNVPPIQLTFPDITVESVATHVTVAKFDLALFMAETAESIQGIVNYSTDLFDGATIERLMARFQALLHAIVNRPETTIDVLEMEASQEKLRKESKEQKIRQGNQKTLRSRKAEGIDLSHLGI